MTQVSWTRQLGLAAALLILGMFAYWAEFKNKPEKEAAEEQSKRLFLLDGTSIQTIRLSGSAAHSEVVLTCLDLTSKLCKPGDQSKWQLTEPTQLRADDSNVNTLISTLNRLNSSETISLKDDPTEKRASLLKEYGLDSDSRKTARKIEVITEKGSTILFLGGTHPIGENLFALAEKVAAGQKPSEKVNDDQVFLIPNFFKSNFEHDLSYWRDKKLFTLASHEIESFQLENSKGKLSGNRKNQPWMIQSQGRDLPGDPDQIDSLLNTATGLKAKSFLSDHKADATAQAALHGASRVLLLNLKKDQGSETKAPDPITLSLYRKKIGSEPSRLYATVSNADPLFEVEPNSLDRFEKGATDLRLSKLLSTLERFNVKRLEFSGKPMGQSPLILTQKEGKWAVDGTQKEVDSNKIQALLDRLSGAAVKDFLGSSSAPQGEAEGLTVKTIEDKKTRTFVFWKAASTLYGKDLGSHTKEAFLMDPSLVQALPWSRDFFNQPEPKAAESPRPEKLKK
jgi:hypothetical protein